MSEKEQAAYDTVLKTIDACRRKGNTSINLVNLGLTRVPPEIGELKALTGLSLSNNSLTTLPPELGNLTALTVLILDNNQLTTLPPELGKLTALTMLHLSNNQLTRVPPEIGELKALTGLSLSNNSLTTLPPELGLLTALTELRLHYNQLAMLPPELGDLTALTLLSISDNRLTTLPSELGKLVALTRLYLSYNQLTKLPSELGNLTALTRLTLEQNALRELPESLKQLNHLRMLTLHRNDALGLPPELLGPTYAESDDGNLPANPREILEHYFTHRKAAQEAGTSPLMEAKLLVLGEASVGKSCLIAALSDGKKRSELDGKGTSGIVRKLWIAPVKGGQLASRSDEPGAENLRLNCWDFGGQEIYHSAHTLFLTKRAIYLIVVSKRENERQNNVDYWLRMAASFGGPGAVTYVVVNKDDEKVGHPPDEEALRIKYPHIRGFLYTSCDDLSGVAKAREEIVLEALRLEGVRLPVAKTWLAVKTHLETMQEHTLSMEEWAALCGKGVSTPDAQRELLHLCDRLGTVRYFPTTKPDSAELCETAILNPEWVTLGIYALLDDAALKARGGLLSRMEMTDILKRRKYPVEHERLIEEVMRRFDLLFDSADHGKEHRMLIPLMLPELMPVFQWPKEGTLEFVYKYEVMPAGLVPAFMARMHRVIATKPQPWRFGCVLELKGCRVRVIGDPEAKRISISVTGAEVQRREALDTVRNTFESLHAAVENLPLQQLIPVPKHPDAPMLDYEFVRSLEWKDKTEFETKGAERGETITVNVGEALEGVRGAERKRADEEHRVNNQTIHNHHYAAAETPVRSAPPEVWWKSWPAISAATAIGCAVVALVLMLWENTTGRLLIAIAGAVFAVMMTHNPKLRFRRLFQWAVVCWMGANTLGVVVAASWKNDKQEATFKLDGSVGWWFNIVFAFVAAGMAFLAYKEGEKDSQ